MARSTPSCRRIASPAKITENRMLNKPGSVKETRHFVVDLTGSGLHYKAGDSLGVFPTNRPSEVFSRWKHQGMNAVKPPASS